MKERISASEYFAILPESVLFAAISSNAVRLYCILRRRADEKSNACYPSQKYLADSMYCSTRTVQRALEELIKIGAVTVEHRMIEGTDAYTSNMYYLHATIAQGSAPVRKGRASKSQGSRAGVVQNIATKQSQQTDSKKRTRKRDLLFEEMCAGLGIDWKNAPAGELGRVNAACKELREIKAKPEEVAAAIKHYKKNWADMTLSAQAITNNWTTLKNEMTTSTPKKRDCAKLGCVNVDLDVILQCRFCKKETIK
jgi:hypothetical protein